MRAIVEGKVRAAAAAALVAGVLAAEGVAVQEVEPQPARRQEAVAEEDAGEEVALRLRITADLGDGRASIDRGARDGVEPGAVVWLMPRDGSRVRAQVESVDDRSAVIAVLALGFQPTAGTRGEVTVIARGQDPAGEAVEAPVEPEAEDAERESSDWSYEDDGFSSDMPLLAGASAVRPDDRAPFYTGRLYASAGRTITSDDGRGDTRLRAGADLTYENAFGYGGTTDFSVEWEDYRFDRPETDDLEFNEVRFERLSYRIGGTRFEPDRWQFGRFLQHGTPEFGVLDGVEYTARLGQHSSLGASVGYMPEPDADYESGHDFQVASWYRWVSDPTEVAAAQVGYQKTWHDGAADRDLVVLKGHYLPRSGWTALGTVWLDIYSSGDELKGGGSEVTQAFVTATPDLGRDAGLDLTYTHLRYPELDRDEILPPVAAAQIAEDRLHRLTLDGWWSLPVTGRLVGGVGGWDDQDEGGGDAELGLEVDEVLGAGTRVRVTGFVTEGLFTSAAGGRFNVRAQGDTLGFGLFYEVANYDQRGFDDDNDDFVQHRARMTFDWRPLRSWTVNAYLDGATWNVERGLTAGVLVQWTF